MAWGVCTLFYLIPTAQLRKCLYGQSHLLIVNLVRTKPPFTAFLQPHAEVGAFLREDMAGCWEECVDRSPREAPTEPHALKLRYFHISCSKELA